MILTLAVVIGVVGCAIRSRGHAASQIASLPLRSTWLALLALLLQLPLLRARAGPPQQVAIAQILFLSSHLLLLAFVWRNWRLRGLPIVGLGVLCNLIVILANGGLMPITPETLVRINPGTSPDQWLVGFHYGYSKDIILAREATNLWFLSDILVLPSPFPWPTAFSLGDLLIALGIVVLLQGPVTLPKLAVTEPSHSQGHARLD
jgi:hypothetical protein